MKKIVDLVLCRSLYNGYVRAHGDNPKELFNLLLQAGFPPGEDQRAHCGEEQIRIRFSLEPIESVGEKGTCAYCGVELKQGEKIHCSGCRQLMELAAMYSDGGGI